MGKVAILGIAGSPRHPSNSEFLLRVALEAAQAVDPEAVETAFYSIRRRGIPTRPSPCGAVPAWGVAWWRWLSSCGRG